MLSRLEEAAIIERCIEVVLDEATAFDQREANVVRFAAMLLRPRFPLQSTRLMEVCKQHFLSHPDDLVDGAQVVRNGWVTNPSRFRDMLEFRLNNVLKRARVR